MRVPGTDGKQGQGQARQAPQPVIYNHDLLRRRPSFSEDKPLITPSCSAFLSLVCSGVLCVFPTTLVSFSFPLSFLIQCTSQDRKIHLVRPHTPRGPPTPVLTLFLGSLPKVSERLLR